MKQYLLLSDNHQSGPFSLDELKEQRLRPLDLIWIENESSAWAYASEIKELEGYVKEQARPAFTSVEKKQAVFISLPSDFSRKHKQELPETYASLPVNETGPVLETNLVQPLEVLKERYYDNSRNRPIWHKKIFHLNDALRLAGVFAGLVFTAMVVKEAADSSVANDSLSTETSVASMIMEDKPAAGHVYQNALVKEVVAPVEEKIITKSVKPKDIRRQVQVKTNDYKTGVFGGINGLQLTIVNSSPHFIDKVVVAVYYYKKNGDLVETRNYNFSSVAPNSTKKLDVPQNRRGFKVKTSISTIYSKEYKSALKQA